MEDFVELVGFIPTERIKFHGILPILSFWPDDGTKAKATGVSPMSVKFILLSFMTHFHGKQRCLGSKCWICGLND